MIEYIVVQTNAPWELQNRVVSRIEEGFIPQGGMSTMCTNGTSGYVQVYCQAMIREVEEACNEDV